MVWSNWQGAIWRGAIVVVLIWSGLAWTQAPVQRPGDPADRIMVVHENGRKIRCRVEETWQLPDGRMAHLLQALETGEKITIVDDRTVPIDPTMKNQKAVPKRIYAWGVGRKTPPEGSPVPPHLRIESGVVMPHEAPSGYQITESAKQAEVQVLDFQRPMAADPKTSHNSYGTGMQIIQVGDSKGKSAPEIVQVGDTLPTIPAPTGADSLPSDPAIPTIEVATGPGLPSVPTIDIMQTQATPTTPSALPNTPAAPMTIVTQAPVTSSTCPTGCIEDPSSKRPWRPGDKIADWMQNRNGQTIVTEVPTTTPVPGTVAQPYAPSTIVTTGPTGSTVIIQDNATDADKKPWRPGDRIINFFAGKSATTTPKTETVTTVQTKKTDLPTTLPALTKTEDALKTPKTDDVATPKKETPEKIAIAQTGPFSTAMGAQPEVKKNDAPPALPTSDPKTALPPAPVGEVKSAAGPTTEKKDMWGLEGAVKPVDPIKMATRANDPLTMPERFVDKRYGGPGPIGAGDMTPGDPSLNGGFPLGTQSVLAAKSGMIGPVTYVPVPTVTVPQPFNPPLPPEPKMPSPPQLNAFVNAFSPPPQPKGVQEYPMQGMMPPQAMNPMMQQQMMQQQAMQQYMMQQQAMQQYAMQNPYAANAAGYPPMVSQGPTMNFARQYQGPQAPNPVGPGPVMPAAYAPAPYPPMMAQQQPMMAQQQPMMAQQQPMMAQQQPVQQAAFQQPNAGQQVDQLIKVLRESPYPAQREWAAQSLTSFEWRTHPQIVPNLLQSASQDPAASVRAGCVFCLGRMGAAVEPVYTTPNMLRNDIDPRVRQEVQQTLNRLGQTATTSR